MVHQTTGHDSLGNRVPLFASLNDGTLFGEV